jgi:hypothetical protein
MHRTDITSVLGASHYFENRRFRFSQPTSKVLIIKKGRKDLDNLQGFQVFGKKKFQRLSVLPVFSDGSRKPVF